MSLRDLRFVRTLCTWSTIGLGTLCLIVIAVAFASPEGDRLPGIVVRAAKKPMPWRVIETNEVQKGVLVPENTNAVFHLPLSMTETDADVLLGHQSKVARYWGYCFAQNYDPVVAKKRTGFPGLIFLSEKEEKARNVGHAAAGQPVFSPYSLPTQYDIDNPNGPKGSIRNQIVSFGPGMMCYIMSEKALAIGTDDDGDALNGEVEREIGTNPQVPDTDADGIDDGTEYLTGTNPLLRDGDGDGLVDGLEDRNFNGKQDKGETDPRADDSDRDGLSDGFRRVRLGNGQHIFLGEDMNLNGKFDQGETDPLKYATRGNYNDYSFRLNCIQNNNTPDGCK